MLMKNSLRKNAGIAFAISFALTGCRSTTTDQARSQVSLNLPTSQSSIGNSIATKSDAVQLASHVTVDGQDTETKSEKSLQMGTVVEAVETTVPQQSSPPMDGIESTRPVYSELVELPIDLPTVIRLVDANSPAVSIAQARVREAQARLARAEVQWLPNLSAGVAYNRFDGQTQNQGGAVFGVSRSNLFAGGGPALSLDLSEAIYRPLIERQQASAEQLRAQAVCLGSELDAVLAYLDLLQVYGSLEINADTTSKAESMLTAAENAKDSKLDRTAGDVNRAKTEVLFRRIERIELISKKGAASARLGKLLLLQPNVMLIPADTAVVPINLIDPSSTIDELLSTAISNRPDLAAMRNLIGAAWGNVRKQEEGPRLPKLGVSNQTGAFGGGLNADVGNFDSRNALSAQLYWELKNLGLGNRYEINERKAILSQVRMQLVESQARACAEIVEVAQSAGAKYESLTLAEQAIQEASELYRINKEGTLNVVDAKNLFDALRPLQAIQTLNQARLNLLNSIIEYNRSQYKLYTLVGNNNDLAPGS
jgi:outer membrane protein TolC